MECCDEATISEVDYFPDNITFWNVLFPLFHRNVPIIKIFIY